MKIGGTIICRSGKRAYQYAELDVTGLAEAAASTEINLVVCALTESLTDFVTRDGEKIKQLFIEVR